MVWSGAKMKVYKRGKCEWCREYKIVGIIKLTKIYNFYDRLGSISISEVFKLIFGDFEK
jgi:hypothetical protein